jgi:hypothetical protein
MPVIEELMNGRTISILLFAIAFGLWANFLSLRVTPALSQETRGYTLQAVYGRLLAIQSDLAELKRKTDEINNSLSEIRNGTCRNPKIC